MTSKDNPRQPDVVAYRTLRDERDRLEADNTALRAENTALIDAVNGHLDTIHKDAEDLRDATRALGEKEMELREARGDAVTANRRRSELGAELHTAQVRIRELEAEGRHLRDANTELHRRLANATAPHSLNASYVVHDPGVYVVTQHGEDGIHVVKHLHRDAVVLTAHPDAEPAEWWQLYRDGLTGNLTAWHPPMGLHELIAATAKAYQDPSARPYVGTAPGRMYSDAESNALREQIMQPGLMAKVGIDPGNGDDLTTVMQTTLTRLARLEAWARQFPRTDVSAVDSDGVFLWGNTNRIEPLDGMETKA